MHGQDVLYKDIVTGGGREPRHLEGTYTRTHTHTHVRVEMEHDVGYLFNFHCG